MSSYYELGGSIEFIWNPRPEIVANEIFEISEYLENTAGPIALSRQIVQDDIRERFETKTSPYGATWAPWARDYPDSQSILIQSGELRDAASGEAVDMTEDTVFFNFGALPFYGAFHEFGANRSSLDAETIKFLEQFSDGQGVVSGTNTLPARPFAGASFEAEEKIVAIFNRWFEGSIALGRTSTGRVFPRHNVRGPGGKFIPKPK